MSDWSSDVCSSDLPAGQHGAEAGGCHEDATPEQHATVIERAAQARGQAPQPEARHGKAERDHEAEAPEHDLGGRSLLLRPGLQALDDAVPFVRQDQRTHVRQLEGSEEHTAELQSLMRLEYAVLC